MGWTGYPGKTQEAAIEEHLRDVDVLARKDTASGVWIMGMTTGTPDPKPMIVLMLVEGHFIKDIDESMGPVRCDCPLEWLDRAPQALGPFASQWRERVRDHWLMENRRWAR